MTFEVLREIFEGDSADTATRNFLASVDGGPSRGSRADPGVRTPINTRGNYS